MATDQSTDRMLFGHLEKHLDWNQLMVLLAASKHEKMDVLVLTAIVEVVEELAEKVPRPISFALLIDYAAHHIRGTQSIYKTLMKDDVMKDVPGWSKMVDQAVTIV